MQQRPGATSASAPVPASPDVDAGPNMGLPGAPAPDVIPSPPLPLPPPPRPTLLRRVLRSPWPWSLLGVVVVAAIGIGIAGGWRGVEPEGLPVGEAGVVHDTGPHDVVLHSWALTTTPLDSTMEYAEETTWVLVSAGITGNGPQSSGLQFGEVELPTLADPGLMSGLRAENLEAISTYHPGVTNDVLLVVPVGEADAAALADATTLEVTLGQLEWREGTFGDPPGWWGGDPWMRVDLPRDDDLGEAP